MWVSRENPDWRYYTAKKNAFSVTELAPNAARLLRLAFPFYDPVATLINDRHVVRAADLFNSVPDSLLRRGIKLVRTVEQDESPPWRGLGSKPEDDTILAIPLETHCVFLGGRTIVVLRGACGYSEYLKQREEWSQRSEVEAELFNFSTTCAWAGRINPARFEELVYAVLDGEPGFEWIRAAGTTSDRDQGRDFMARWLTPPHVGERVDESEAQSPFRTREIVVQVKTRSRTVGKSDVRDVRDTLERCDASGFFLVAFPTVSNDLMNYLESLRRQGYWVDWWCKQQIEDRIRRRPYIAARFHDLLRLKNTAG